MVEAVDPEQVLLGVRMKRSTQPLRAREGGRAFDAEEGDLALEVVDDELVAVIATPFQARFTAVHDEVLPGLPCHVPDRLTTLPIG